MPYADVTDVNRWLDSNKVIVTSGDYVSEEDSAERIIRGYLTGKVDGATMNTWTTPSSTPEMIREIAGQFVAAFRYRKLYSEDSAAVDNNYGQLMYDEAMYKLMGVIEGTIDLKDLPTTAIVTGESNLTEANFYPDDTTQGTSQDRRFSWDFEF